MGAAVAETTPRVRRLERLSAMIQRRLDQEVASLARARQHRARASEAVESAAARLKQAASMASDALATGLQAEQWSALFSWQDSLRAELEAATAREEECRRNEAEARTRVLIAHEDLHRMNTLIKRLESAERLDRNRRERRAEDDVYAALASPASRLER